jgi:hypothetical protein
MPPSLAAIVFRYDKATHRTIIDNWSTVGDSGQQDYREYLSGAHLSWTRRRRSRELAVRLITGSK